MATEKDGASRYIPADVKRAVRQKCGFGCVVCGLPIYTYDHVENFSKVKEHKEENIILLCPTHHLDKTAKRITKEAILRYANAPVNLTKDRSTPHPILKVGDLGRFEVGGNVYEFVFSDNNNSFEAISILGHTVFGIDRENGYLMLDILLTDKDGDVIFQIDRGEMTVSTGVWDYKIEGQNIEIRSEEDEIELALTIDEHGVTVHKGNFIMPPYTLQIEPDHHTILPQRITMSGCRMSGCLRGLVVS